LDNVFRRISLLNFKTINAILNAGTNLTFFNEAGGQKKDFIVFQINNFKKPDRFLKPVRFGTEIIFMKNYRSLHKSLMPVCSIYSFSEK